MNIFKNLYNYRELIKTSVKKDIGGKYKHSFLGVLWSFNKSTFANCCVCNNISINNE